MKSYKPLLALLCAAALSSCDKNTVQSITAADPGANIKYFNYGVNAPGVNFYADNTKATAISSATGVESTSGTAYAAAAAGGFYTGILPGSYTLTGKIAATTDNGVSISPVPATVGDGKFYSYYISGFYNTTSKTAEAFIVDDPLPAVNYTVAYVRFVNAVSNANPMTLYALNTTTTVEYPIGAAVAYRSAGAFTAIPAGTYDLNTRSAGSSTNVLTLPTIGFLAGRVYTVSALGDITVTLSTAATRARLLSTTTR